MCNTGDLQLLNDLEFFLGKHIQAVEMPEHEILRMLGEIYGTKPLQNDVVNPQRNEFQVLTKDQDHQQEPELDKEVDDQSVVSLVNRIITEAIEQGVSDVHIEAYEREIRVRYRIDGVLKDVLHPPLGKKHAIISRLKIMADLDIAEKRRPQDGRIRVRRGTADFDKLSQRGKLSQPSGGELVEPRVIDIRTSTLPTDFGEKVVLRILDKSRLNLDLTRLGFEEQELQSFKKAISSPFGIILVTGPTGSGKTTTLYATLNELNSPELNILTIEDPIEYNLHGINQSQVRSDIGYTFAKALRAFLRQDPDIIMVGEIRDQETAEIAIRAALTGHLVLSTLHTNDAPSAITRLLDMGLEPFLVSSSVKMVIAQRLVRKICEHCKVEDEKEVSVTPSRFHNELRTRGGAEKKAHGSLSEKSKEASVTEKKAHGKFPENHSGSNSAPPRLHSFLGKQDGVTNSLLASGLSALGIEETVDEHGRINDFTFYKGRGCQQCHDTGYRGQVAVFEVMPITQRIAEKIHRRATAQEMKEEACREGMRTLRQSAINKLRQGITTVQEVLRETEA
jgi:type II secretory ATPase GspE/PulE/Tfp pilus assembly ATPase PilB-like protein